MSNTVQDALAKAQFKTDDAIYRIISLPANAITVAAAILAEIGEAFSAIIVDQDEVTLIIDEEALEEYRHRLLGHVAGPEQWALITVDVVLEHDLVGFMAVLSAALAKQKIPIFCFGAFKRDHLLVPLQQREEALKTLHALHNQES